MIPCAGSAPAVLLVEPDKDCRQLIALTLRTTGVRVVSTRDAEEALPVFYGVHPPLVILELNLPPPVGLALVRTMAGGGPRETAIIVLTAVTERSWIEQAMAAGCTLYLCKPFSLQTLRLAVTRLLPELPPPMHSPGPLAQRSFSDLR